MQLGNIRFHQGRLHELIPLMEQALADSPALYAYRAALTLATARAGDIDRARAMLEADHADGFPMPEDHGWSTGIAAWAEAAFLARAAPAIIAALRERIMPHHDRVVTTTLGFSASLAHRLGRLDHRAGRYDDAERPSSTDVPSIQSPPHSAQADNFSSNAAAR